MNRFIAAAALTAILGACTAQQRSDLVADAKQACADIAPTVQLASLVPDPRVISIVGFASSVCTPLAAGVVVPTLDANTRPWLGDLGRMLKVLVPR